MFFAIGVNSIHWFLSTAGTKPEYGPNHADRPRICRTAV